jgi:L-iditol 2-dehydrogenase
MPTRLKLARKFGATHALDASDSKLSESFHRITRKQGFDAAVLTVPADPPLHQAQDAVRGGGTTLLFAHTVRGRETPIDLSKVCVDEKSLTGSYSADFTLQRAVARRVFSRDLDVRPLITHTFPLEETAQAVDRASNPAPDSLKIVVSPLLPPPTSSTKQ